MPRGPCCDNLEFEVKRAPSPKGSPGLVSSSDGSHTVDLYALAERQLDTVPTGSKDSVHWNAAVSRLFAEAIVAEVERALKR